MDTRLPSMTTVRIDARGPIGRDRPALAPGVALHGREGVRILAALVRCLVRRIDCVEIFVAQCERLFDEYVLASLEGIDYESGMAVVTGGNHMRVDAVLVSDCRICRRSGETELAPNLSRRTAARGHDRRERRVGFRECRQQNSPSVVARADGSDGGFAARRFRGC